MFMRTAVFALGLGVSAVVASPLYKRQENITDSSVASGTSTDLASVATDTASVQSSVTSALSSVVESASSATSTAPAPTETQAGNDTQTFTGCPANYSLTYAIGVNTYPVINISTAYTALENWGNAVPPPIQAVSAEGEGVGATRSWTLNGLNASEVLVNVTQNATTGDLEQQWNLTQPLNVSESLIIANAATALTLYSNATTNETTVQLFVNFCVNDQPAGLELYANIVSGYLNGLNAVFTNSTGNSTAGGAGGATSSAAESSAAPTSTAESSAATDSATSAVSSASSAAEGVTGTAVSGASSVAGVATSGAGGALSTAVGAVTGAAETAISGATSVFGQVTGIIPTRRV